MKKIIPTLLLLISLFAVALQPLSASAVSALDVDADASLTLYYQKDGKSFSSLNISIYRVAEASPDGSFQLVSPFSSYPVTIHDVTNKEDWKRISHTLYSYTVANNVAADAVKATDENGCVYFPGLKTGLYLVSAVVADNEIGTYIFDEFMVYLPSQLEDGSYEYNMEAKPKCSSFAPKTEYTVTKLWQDTGDLAIRPREVTVDIYRNGELKETKVLSTENSWTYTWTVPDDDKGIWTVTERAEHEDYTVTVTVKDNTFTVINASETLPEAPQTGDSFAPLPWIIAMCFSGIILLILSIYRRRCA